ncbi:nucleotidyltransferase domain-containing protein [Algiphilus sp.]|uniref:type VII toxin-antitoxin system MntA family adenylyltransferase antitoxin n=2 Tax=Algiphilus sp. TaxID=1872431 RepID=UPI00345151DB|nr:nucleotidyltransferase domain-containing protein [Algiphilus sp.]
MGDESRDRIARFVAEHADVRTAILFGSIACGRQRPDSDVDIAVDTGVPLDASAKQALITQLADATGRPVDLVDLQSVGEPLLGQILKHGVRLKGANADYAELVRRHLFDAADFLPYVDRMLAERRSTWIG